MQNLAGKVAVVTGGVSRTGRAFRERAQEQLLGWWREGKLRPSVDDLVAFETLPKALERLAAGGVKDKLALTVDPKATVPAGVAVD